MASAVSRAGASSVPPPPSSLSMRANAFCTFSAVAGTDSGDIWIRESENKMTLKRSLSRRLPAKLDVYKRQYQERVDDIHSAVRFCTSWATKEENVNSLIEDLKNC